MSRNSKSHRRTEERKQWSATRKGGGKGPSRTTPKKDKRFSYRNPPPNVAKDRAEKLAAILGKTRPKSVMEQLKEGKDKQPKAKNVLLKKEAIEVIEPELIVVSAEADVIDALPIPLDVLEKFEDEALETIVPHKPHGTQLEEEA